ncbi:hypothetical protein ACFY2W_18000 [Streptomyces sp. NPDC001262]|uniref:hypothetical protein n=1 Tax=unclassified Streptomyces TaxID=2593676 RepID=UPI0036C0A4BA
MTHDDATMTRIEAAVTLHREGDTEGARMRLGEIWQDIGPDGDAFHRCVLAHYMADVQPDPEDELVWDLRALEAAESLTDDRVQEHHASLAVRGFCPSLHLNLAESYRRTGNAPLAREHLSRAREHADTLGDDAYGDGIRAALDRLELRLAGTGGTPPVGPATAGAQ